MILGSMTAPSKRFSREPAFRSVLSHSEKARRIKNNLSNAILISLKKYSLDIKMTTYFVKCKLTQGAF